MMQSMKHFFKKNLKKILAVFILLVITAGFIFWVINRPSVGADVVVTKETPISIQTDKTNADFHLLIPSLDIAAPIIADVDGNNKDAYFKALQGGVAHYKNTAKPGEGGNIFIFGHSSYYAWDPGKYKTIFRPLDKIKTNDEIDIWYSGKEYKYKVAETKIVEPTDVSVLKPTSTEQVTLMTCYPPGTTQKRFIVIAKPN